MKPPGPLTRLFFWLSGASDESLAECPAWERRKYVAFGATVLVPSAFAAVAAAYALSTLTDDWRVIAAVSLVWSFIILTVDRALLATYRAYQSFFRKLSQFSLRIVVAALMGLSISHPLALLLFRDTINTSIEKQRDADISAARKEFETNKKAVEAKIAALDAEVATQRKQWDETFNAKFLVQEALQGAAKPMTAEEAKAKQELDKKIADATAPSREKITTIEKEITSLNEQATKLQGELDFWQKEFERELNGQRSGIIGLGPRAKSIQADQLAWRRDESKRLSGLLESFTSQLSQLRADVASTEQSLTSQAEVAAAEALRKSQLEQQRLEGLKQQVQQQQADSFVEQQNGIRATLRAQIDAKLEQSKSFAGELTKLQQDEQARVDAIRAEPRRGILTQTKALHALFENDAEGGQFALIAYAVLTALFMLVDTIPLVVKFFSKPGPYDTLLDQDETRFDKERLAFLKSYNRYMEGLSEGRLLHLTRNKPLEHALIEGVDRSRAAKEFLEHLLELERAFDERIRRERELVATQEGSKAAMVEEMAQAFYRDMRRRMELFFHEETPSRISA
ncbi:uncharacterized protein DUF4407 [Roseimicrobium gellanilyticum]|uniref:Uncharacterized protein DUF4407 n=1 Tax=Roseimicrobium gellanilyticum TaxID=748857 RepID=A0A366H7K8_9BACT|nr:DUF4407 domain-containing protein [Roseimicrobium gellanilyticum]RBP37290.1 uncharacterized protein DUF4407 [Roseimicrobium gellanilyticum]